MRYFCVIIMMAMVSCSEPTQNEEIVKATIEAAMTSAHKAWTAENVDAVIEFEHPDIHKLVSFDKVVVGRDASRADYEALIQAYNFKVSDFSVEDFELNGNVATFYGLITLEGTPKGDGYPFSVTSRTLSVWVRDDTNPQKWLAYREVVQSAPVERMQ